MLGAPPQNTKHKGGRTTLVIGGNCTIREGVTMHTGTDTSRGETSVGDNGNFLAYSHVAHDCMVGSNVTMANGAMLAGHCEIGDNVNIGGLTAVHQFCADRRQCLPRRLSAVLGDVIPYGMVRGQPGDAARPERHRHDALRHARERHPRDAAGLPADLRPGAAGRPKIWTARRSRVRGRAAGRWRSSTSSETAASVTSSCRLSTASAMTTPMPTL